MSESETIDLTAELPGDAAAPSAPDLAIPDLVIDVPETRPVVHLMPGKQKRVEQGHPWIYSNEIMLDAAAKALPQGSLVTVVSGEGRRLGVATFNAHALITLRLLDRDHGRRIDARFFAARLSRALSIRQDLFDQPYYRLVHAEADGLPGVIVDRYGDAIVCQINTAGMARLEAALIKALTDLLKPNLIVFRNDTAARHLEGLEPETRVVLGEMAGPLELIENDCRFVADLTGGQKTGWFYDQRPNRAFVAKLAKGRRVLDAYAFTGGFGIQAAIAEAADVTLLDRSEPALVLAKNAADLNGVSDRCHTLRGEVFEELERLGAAKERFGIVILDPPAFVKSRKDLGAGTRGYRKLARLGAALVDRAGYMMAASCSHNMELAPFMEAVRQGIQDAGRTSRIIHIGGAGPDHPTHPSLPESAYLKAVVLAID